MVVFLAGSWLFFWQTAWFAWDFFLSVAFLGAGGKKKLLGVTRFQQHEESSRILVLLIINQSRQGWEQGVMLPGGKGFLVRLLEHDDSTAALEGPGLRAVFCCLDSTGCAWQGWKEQLCAPDSHREPPKPNLPCCSSCVSLQQVLASGRTMCFQES